MLKPQRVTTIESKWNLVKLGDMVIPMGGLWTGKKPPFKTVNVIRNTNFKKGGKLDFSDIAQIEVEEKQFENRRLEKGDIIIEKSGGSETQAVGRVVLFSLEKGDYSFSNFTARLRPDNEKIDSIFLHLYLNYFYDLGYTFDFQNGASGLKNLDLNRYLEVKIPLPPLDIQHKIVAECEGIDLEVSEAEESLQKLELALEEIFSDNNFDTKRLEEVVNKQTEQIDPSKHTGEVFYVGLENIESNTGKIVGNPITQYGTIRSNKNVYQVGDLLYGKLRPNLNKVYLAKEGGICSTDILVLRCFDESLNKFYAYYFRTKQFNDEVVKTVSGQQLPRTKWSLMETIKVPVPKDQEQLIAQIEQLEGIIKQNQATIDGSSERKKAVMKQYL